MASTDPPVGTPESLDKFHEIEIQKVFESLVSIQNLRAQIGTFFGTANLTALGIAFTVQKAGLIFLIGLSLVVYVILDLVARRALLAYYYRALVLQERFAPNDSDTFLDIFQPPNIERQVRRIVRMSTPAERYQALWWLPIKRATFTGVIVPTIVCILELVIAVTLWQQAQWPLF